MPRSLGSNLPHPLVELLDGTGLPSREGATFLLVTVGETGWPHVALLSVGEVLAVSPQELRLALWSSSRTTTNLTRTGQGSMALVHGGAAYRLQLAARRAGEIDVAGQSLACFTADVVDVIEDAVGYAELVSGVTFRLREPGEVLARWAETIAKLRHLPA